MTALEQWRHDWGDLHGLAAEEHEAATHAVLTQAPPVTTETCLREARDLVAAGRLTSNPAGVIMWSQAVRLFAGFDKSPTLANTDAALHPSSVPAYADPISDGAAVELRELMTCGAPMEQITAAVALSALSRARAVARYHAGERPERPWPIEDGPA